MKPSGNFACLYMIPSPHQRPSYPIWCCPNASGAAKGRRTTPEQQHGTIFQILLQLENLENLEADRKHQRRRLLVWKPTHSKESLTLTHCRTLRSCYGHFKCGRATFKHAKNVDSWALRYVINFYTNLSRRCRAQKFASGTFDVNHRS